MNALLDTQWIVGFLDSEGYFDVTIRKRKGMPQVLPEFTIFQEKKNIQILYRIKKFFQCGVVKPLKNNVFCYRIRHQKHLRTILLPFFEKHSFKTKKQIDFLKFRKILLLMESMEPFDNEIFKRIETIQKTMEKGSER